MSKLENKLEAFYNASFKNKKKSFVKSDDFRDKVEFICRNNSTKAPIRFLMSCQLAKIDNPQVDIRKP